MKVEKILNDEILDFQADIYAFNVVSSGCTYKFHEVHDIITKAFIDGFKFADKKPYYFDDVNLYDFKLPSGKLWSSKVEEQGSVVNFTWEKALMFDIPTEDDFKELINNTGFIHGQKSTRFEKGNLSNIQSLPCGFWIKGNDFSQPLYVDSTFTIRHGNINDVRCIVVLKRVGDSSK